MKKPPRPFGGPRSFLYCLVQSSPGTRAIPRFPSPAVSSHVFMMFRPVLRPLTRPRPPGDFAARLFAAVIRLPLLFCAMFLSSSSVFVLHVDRHSLSRLGDDAGVQGDWIAVIRIRVPQYRHGTFTISVTTSRSRNTCDGTLEPSGGDPGLLGVVRVGPKRPKRVPAGD
jgi:hypothetical protein